MNRNADEKAKRTRIVALAILTVIPALILFALLWFYTIPWQKQAMYRAEKHDEMVCAQMYLELYFGLQNCVKKYDHDQLVEMLKTDWLQTILPEIKQHDTDTIQWKYFKSDDFETIRLKYISDILKEADYDAPLRIMLNENSLEQPSIIGNDIVLFFSYFGDESKLIGNEEDCLNQAVERCNILMSDGVFYYQTLNKDFSLRGFNW
ncbi:MAG: hypothetical protein AB7F23_10175 [Phycisphaerae bacterium]